MKDTEKMYRVGFAGSGTVARAHAYAIATLPYYYPNLPAVLPTVVASRTREQAREFAQQFRFGEGMAIESLWKRDDVDTIFILGPNHLHHEHFQRTLELPSVRRIYIEKPVCVTEAEEQHVGTLITSLPDDICIRIGFQFLQMPAAREAFRRWRAKEFGEPLHFQVRYLHSGYLKRSYRDRRRAKLKPAPIEGALVDLGSHAFSLLVAFLGTNIDIIAAKTAGNLPDVTYDSDLCTVVLATHPPTGAAGTLVASRISSGAIETLDLEIRGTRGAFRFSAERPDILETSLGDCDDWTTFWCGHAFAPASTFPAAYVTSGWLRSLVHAHYLFFAGADDGSIIPDLQHGLAVQRLLRETLRLSAGTGT